MFDIYSSFTRLLQNDEVWPPSLAAIVYPIHSFQLAVPLSAIIALTELLEHSDGIHWCHCSPRPILSTLTHSRHYVRARRSSQGCTTHSRVQIQQPHWHRRGLLAVHRIRDSLPPWPPSGCNLVPHPRDTRCWRDPQSFADLKQELIRQGRQYAEEALTYRKKIAELAVGFIKDGSVVRMDHVPSECIRLTSHRSSHILTQGLWCKPFFLHINANASRVHITPYPGLRVVNLDLS